MPELTSQPPAVWRNRIVGHAEVPPAELVPNPRNWRTHPPEQQRALAGALTEVGWVGEVLVNRTTGRVVDGHLRIDLALERHEPAVPVTYVELTEDDVGDPRPRRSESHPTMKPVELVARALAFSSAVGDLVYEPSAGSGSTIIAAEQTGRRCVALEIDPHYAQVAIERWASFTGREPERIDG